MGDPLLLAFLFLAAAIVTVPVATRLGLGSVLGFLLAGVLLSPVLRSAGADVAEIQHVAEFGVVMMLFLVGLELEPKVLWELRSKILGLGGLQVLVTTALVAGAALWMGQTWQVSLACGLILSLSSTAIVLQTLTEKGLLKSDGGQSSFTVLLFQDVAVIPILAFLPLLAVSDLAGVATGSDGHSESMSLVEGLPGWQVTAITLGAVAAVIGVGVYLIGPLFRFVARAGLRELFVAMALALVVGIALLMEMVGLSPALGAFVAGVVLANSEYRHELESDIAPMRGFLLGLFFITVGASINFDVLSANAVAIVGLTFGLIALKAAVLLLASFLFSIKGTDRWLLALGLAQAGEFGFVLISFSTSNSILPAAVADLLLLVVTLSMMVTPLLFIAHDRLLAPRFSAPVDMPADDISDDGDIIIAGHGRFGSIVNRVLLSAGYNTVVLDYSAERLSRVREWGVRAFYGDISRPDMLVSAGIARAKVLVVAIDDYHQALQIVRYTRRHYPHVKVVARAKDLNHAFDLDLAGAHHHVRQYFESSVRLARTTCEVMGMHPWDAEQLAQTYKEEDQILMKELSHLYKPDEEFTPSSEFGIRLAEIRAERNADLRRRGASIRERAERGWQPPDSGDVEAMVDRAAEEDAEEEAIHDTSDSESATPTPPAK